MLKASMPTKTLTPNERLALQTGAILQLRISAVDEAGEISVKFNNVDTIASGKLFEDAEFNVRSSVSIEKMIGTKKPSPKKSTSSANSSKVSVVPTSGPLLNNLKTGMKLEGIVATSTPYAAFINAGVYRASKGDSFTVVHVSFIIMIYICHIIYNNTSITYAVYLGYVT